MQCWPQQGHKDIPDLNHSDGSWDWWKGCRVGEAKNPGPPNAEQQDQGDTQPPDSKRLKEGPKYHITVHFLPNGET